MDQTAVFGADGLAFRQHLKDFIIGFFVTPEEFSKLEKMPRIAAEAFVKLLAPYAPHLCEELWEVLGNAAPVSLVEWPSYDESCLVENEVEILVQVNGKPRARMMMPADAAPAVMEALAKENDEVKKNIAGKQIIKVVAVPKRIVNFVVR